MDDSGTYSVIFGSAFTIVGVGMVGLWLSSGPPLPHPPHHSAHGAGKHQTPAIRHVQSTGPAAGGSRPDAAMAQASAPANADAITTSIKELAKKLDDIKTGIDQLNKDPAPEKIAPLLNDIKTNLDGLNKLIEEYIQARVDKLADSVEALQNSSKRIETGLGNLQSGMTALKPSSPPPDPPPIGTLDKDIQKLEVLIGNVQSLPAQPGTSPAPVWAPLPVWAPIAGTAAFVCLVVWVIVLVRWPLSQIRNSLPDAAQRLSELKKAVEEALRVNQSRLAAPPPEGATGTAATTALRRDMQSLVTSVSHLRDDIRGLSETRPARPAPNDTAEFQKLHTALAAVTGLLHSLEGQITSTARATPTQVAPRRQPDIRPDLEVPPYPHSPVPARAAEQPISIPEGLLPSYNGVLADNSRLPGFKRQFQAVWANRSGAQLVADDHEPPSGVADGFLFVPDPPSGGGVLVPGLSFFQSRSALNDPLELRRVFAGIFTIQLASQDQLMAPATVQMGADGRLNILKTGELHFRV